MTINDLIGGKCAHKIAVENKITAGDTLSEREKYCAYQCSGAGYECDGHVPLQDVKNFDEIFFGQHIHSQK